MRRVDFAATYFYGFAYYFDKACLCSAVNVE